MVIFKAPAIYYIKNIIRFIGQYLRFGFKIGLERIYIGLWILSSVSAERRSAGGGHKFDYSRLRTRYNKFIGI